MQVHRQWANLHEPLSRSDLASGVARQAAHAACSDALHEQVRASTAAPTVPLGCTCTFASTPCQREVKRRDVLVIYLRGSAIVSVPIQHCDTYASPCLGFPLGAASRNQTVSQTDRHLGQVLDSMTCRRADSSTMTVMI